MGDGSDFLLARPSFVEGLSRTLDIGCTLDEYNRSVLSEQADYLAISNDWRLIAQDIRKVMTPRALHGKTNQKAG
jgi:hypothetical protein